MENEKMNVYKIIVNDGIAMLETRTRKKRVVFTLFNQITKALETKTKLFDFGESATNEINKYKEVLKIAHYKIVEVEKSTIIVKTQYPIDEMICCFKEHKFDDDPFIEELDEINGDLEDVFENAMNEKDSE